MTRYQHNSYTSPQAAPFLRAEGATKLAAPSAVGNIDPCYVFNVCASMFLICVLNVEIPAPNEDFFLDGSKA